MLDYKNVLLIDDFLNCPNRLIYFSISLNIDREK